MNPSAPKVTLVRHTADPEHVITAAAKLCYAEDTADLLAREPEAAGRFARMLKDLGHLSPVEHVAFTFYVEGISRAMTHQLVRHRLASYSQRSQRYVSHRGFDYVVPPSLEGKTVTVDGEARDATKYFEETMALMAERYAALVEALGGAGEASHEDARYVLPNACETKLFVTMNARELLHFFEERLCLRAQWEIRGVAGRMLALVKEVCPNVFAGAGPKCLRLGRCPEGKRTCGQFDEVKRLYAASF